VDIGWRRDPYPAAHGRHPLPSERAVLISNLLPGEKVLRYEADEGSLESKSRLSTPGPKCLLKSERSRAYNAELRVVCVTLRLFVLVVFRAAE